PFEPGSAGAVGPAAASAPAQSSYGPDVHGSDADTDTECLGSDGRFDADPAVERPEHGAGHLADPAHADLRLPSGAEAKSGAHPHAHSEQLGPGAGDEQPGRRQSGDGPGAVGAHGAGADADAEQAVAAESHGGPSDGRRKSSPVSAVNRKSGCTAKS